MEDAADTEARRLVGEDLETHRAAQAVQPADEADDEALARPDARAGGPVGGIHSG
jgi:hypothetical protein